MKISDAGPRIRNEWLKRPEDKRTENDVLVFYRELEKNRPGLLSFPYGGPDRYQYMHVILRGLITELDPIT